VKPRLGPHGKRNRVRRVPSGQAGLVVNFDHTTVGVVISCDFSNETPPAILVAEQISVSGLLRWRTVARTKGKDYLKLCAKLVVYAVSESTQRTVSPNEQNHWSGICYYKWKSIE